MSYQITTVDKKACFTDQSISSVLRFQWLIFYRQDIQLAGAFVNTHLVNCQRLL